MPAVLQGAARGFGGIAAGEPACLELGDRPGRNRQPRLAGQFAAAAQLAPQFVGVAAHGKGAELDTPRTVRRRSGSGRCGLGRRRGRRQLCLCLRRRSGGGQLRQARLMMRKAGARVGRTARCRRLTGLGNRGKRGGDGRRYGHFRRCARSDRRGRIGDPLNR